MRGDAGRFSGPTNTAPTCVGFEQAGALALLGHFVYFWTLGALFSVVDWLVHREQPSDAPADKPAQAAMRRSSSRTQLAGV